MRLKSALGHLGAVGAAEVRRAFTSIGSCSVRDPMDDLIRLGLLSPPGSHGS
ncbi:hypothetical protein ACWDR0_01080 [Streptomyces sp. NPDC003691]